MRLRLVERCIAIALNWWERVAHVHDRHVSDEWQGTMLPQHVSERRGAGDCVIEKFGSLE